jgi:hypothetical protein
MNHLEPSTVDKNITMVALPRARTAITLRPARSPPELAS